MRPGTGGVVTELFEARSSLWFEDTYQGRREVFGHLWFHVQGSSSSAWSPFFHPWWSTAETCPCAHAWCRGWSWRSGVVAAWGSRWCIVSSWCKPPPGRAWGFGGSFVLRGCWSNSECHIYIRVTGVNFEVFFYSTHGDICGVFFSCFSRQVCATHNNSVTTFVPANTIDICVKVLFFFVFRSVTPFNSSI